MTRTSRTLLYAPVIGVIALVAFLAAYAMTSSNPSQSKNLAVATSFERQDAALSIYAGGYDVAAKDTANSALPYHKRDGSWAVETPVFVGLARRGPMPAPDGSLNLWKYATFKDGSLEFLAQKSDGKTNIERLVYFPLPDGDDASLRHLQSLARYSSDGKDIVDSTTLWLSGSVRQREFVDADSRRHVVAYAEDGVTKLGERIFDKPEYPGRLPRLNNEHRWLNNARHSEIYADVLNDDGTRTVVASDENGFKLWAALWSKYDTIHGTIVDGYYPGTIKVRYHSESTAETDKVDYFSEKGTRLYHLDINTTFLSVSFYDQSGTKLRLTQMFNHEDSGDLNLAHSVLTLNSVFVYDEDGSYLCEWHINHGEINLFEKKNDTVKGVTYPRVAYFFYQHKLSLASFWTDPKNVDGGPTTVDRDPTWNVVPPEVPAEYLQLHFDFGDDMLPVPPPQHSPFPR